MKTPFLLLAISFILIFSIYHVKGEFYHHINDNVVLNVKKFGAVGDGKTDDYKALKAVTDSVNKLNHVTVYFPKGNYYIAEYNDSLHNNFDLKYNNCNGVSIKGENAIITLNGNFKRTADIQGKGY